MRLFRFLTGLLFVSLFAGLASADIPHFIKYQGLLTDTTGATLEGPQNMTFKLYDAATDGNLLWTESQSVSVSDGLFQVSLGAVNTLTQDIFDAAQVWIGVTVGNNSELSPRDRIAAVPYALQAEVAQSVASPAGSGWILAGNLGDLDAGSGQISGYPRTEYEYGLPIDGNIYRARCVFVQGPGLVFHTIEPFITSISISATEFKYGGFLFMKGTIVPEDDGATSTNWYAGAWTFDYAATDGFPIGITTSFGFSGSQVYVRKL